MSYTRATSFDDWVWVKDKVFSVKDDSCVSTFLVEWNEVDCMFAVTSRFSSRMVRDKVDNSETEAFSISAIHGIHHTLHSLNSNVPKLPTNLPKEPKGLKAVFVGMQMPQNKTKLCRDLEDYFTKAAERVGSRVLHEVMFEAAAHAIDNYYELMSEVHKSNLSQKIVFVEDELKNIAFERENCSHEGFGGCLPKRR